MNAMCKKFVADESGLETVEYAIITGLVVAGVVVTIGLLGVWIKEQFDDLADDLGIVA